ncbi:MAG: FHA domain-containing protein [Chloroflexota bacterium]
MGQTMGRLKPTGRWRLPAAAGAALLLLLSAVPASSQTEAISLRITQVDTSAFPEVRLLVAAQDTAADPVDVAASSFTVSEDGVPLPLASVSPAEVGVRVYFVVEPGDGYGSTAISFATTVATAFDSLGWFISGRPWMAAGIDEVAVLIQEGSNSNLLVPLTADGAALMEAVLAYSVSADYRYAPQHGYYTRAALMRALDEIEYAAAGREKLAAIVLFSAGSLEDYADVAERALNLGVPIYVVLVRTPETETFAEYWSQALRPMAEATMGEFIVSGEMSALDSLFNDVTSLRRQQILSYRSASASSGARQVRLDLTTSVGVLSAAAQYSISVQPPQVNLLTPGAGTVIVRQGLGRSSTPEEAVPDFTTVVAQMAWPDGYPRRLRGAQLLVNDLPTGQARLTEAGVEITWDLRAYQTEAQVPAVLIVQVEDELGLQAASAPVTVAVEYQPKPGFDFSESVLLYVSGGVSLVALALGVFLFIKRKKVGPAVHQVGEGIVDFIERVTGRRSSLVARAFLVPLEGFDEPPTKSFEVYGTTAIGRSRRHADLLFHINEEDSPISRLHCTILDEDDHFAIRDEDSSNGTFLNGEKLTPLTAVVLQDGDTLDIAPLERGGLRFLFQVAGADGSQPEPGEEIRRTRPRRRPTPAGPKGAEDES